MAVTTPQVDLRERLVAATAAVIDEDGPLAVRVDKIARRAGCSRATVYRYVADKDELVREVLVARSAEIAERLEADIDEDGDPADWIVNGLLLTPKPFGPNRGSRPSSVKERPPPSPG